MNRLLSFLSIIMMLLMQCCTSETDSILLESDNASDVISHMTVKYNDQIYETDVMTMGESVIYLNTEFSEIYRTKIATNPDIATLVSSDEKGTYVEYYANEKELLHQYNFAKLDVRKFPLMGIVMTN